MAVEDLLRNIAFPLLRFSAYITHALLLGVPVILLLVLRPSIAALPVEQRGARAAVAARLEGLVRAALLGAAVATALLLLLQAALTSELGTGEVSGNDFLSVFETTFGQWLALRFPLLAALAVVLVGKVRSSSLAGLDDEPGAPATLWWGVWIGLGVVLMSTSALSGHALVGRPQAVSLINDVVHVVAASIWFAGIVLLAVVLPEAWRGRIKAERLRVLAPSVSRFSMVALVSIGVAAVTGTINSFLHVGHLDDLWDSSYGRALSLKILIFIGILSLGAVNHFVVRDRLTKAVTSGEPAREAEVFRHTIAAELALALAIMIATGLLTYLSRTEGKDLLPTSGVGAAAPAIPGKDRSTRSS